MKYLLILTLSGCGVTIHSDPIKVEPIVVNYQINLASIEPYCQNKCELDINPDACTNSCVNNIMAILGAIVVK